MNMYDVGYLNTFAMGDNSTSIVIYAISVIVFLISIGVWSYIMKKPRFNFIVALSTFAMCIILPCFTWVEMTKVVNQHVESEATIKYSKYSAPVLVKKNEKLDDSISFIRLSDGENVSISSSDISGYKKLKGGQVVKIRLVYLQGAKKNKRYRLIKHKPIQYKLTKQIASSEQKETLLKMYLND